MTQKNETKLSERLVLLSRVASMYYEQDMAQKDIANALGFSRSAISRFLTEARDLGIVEIRINHPLERNHDMESQLRARFELQDTRILLRDVQPYDQALVQMGALGAELLEQYIGKNSIFGVTWGSSVYQVSHAVRATQSPDMHIIQILGSISPHEPQFDGVEITRGFSRKFGCSYQTLPTPLLVDTKTLRDALVHDSHVQPAFQMMREIDVALIGVAATDREHSSLVRAGYLTPEQADDIARSGVVAECCGIFIDIDGKVHDDLPIANQVIGIDAATLRSTPLVIAIAAGEPKASAILGVLRSGIVDVLISDDLTVQIIIDLIDQEPEY